MTRSVVATAFGGPDVLSVETGPTPSPAAGQVLVEVRAAAINPLDWKQYSGAMGADPAALPMPLGLELAGVVTAVGPGVTTAQIGDEVIAFPARGAYATDVVVRESALTAKPAELGWPEAAGLLLVGTTAVHLLTATDVTGGETVLAHGAAGGVGLVLVQLAVARGATVIATASERNHALLQELGAVPVAYGDGLVDRVRALAPQGVDVALDLVGSDEAVDASLALVEDRRRIASIAAFGRGGELGIQLLGNGPGADPGTDVRRAARPDLLRRAAGGELRLVVSQTSPLEDAAEAHRRGLAGHTVGKAVLVP